MPQILPTSPGIGALLGQGLGQGISSGLDQIAQIKTNRLLQRHQQKETAQGLQAIGFSPQEAHQVAMLPKDLQGFVVKNYLAAAENAGLMHALAGLSGEQKPSSPAQQVNQGPQEDQLSQMLRQATEPQQQQQKASLPPYKRPLTMQEVAQQLLGGATQQVPEDQKVSEEKAPPRSPPLPGNKPEEKRNQLSELLKNPRLTPEHRLKVEALKQQRELAEKNLSAKAQEEVNKETKPVYDQIQKEARVAKENDMRLDRMEQLINNGNLSSPTWSALIKAIGHGIFGFGIDLSAALTADSQEFDKLATDFLKGAKDTFGGRVTNDEVKAFLKTFPSLTQSKEGKKRVIRDLRIFNKGKKARKEASDAILKENGGERPGDYEQLVDDRTNDILDELAQQFKNSSLGPEEYSGLFIE